MHNKEDLQLRKFFAMMVGNLTKFMLSLEINFLQMARQIIFSW